LLDFFKHSFFVPQVLIKLDNTTSDTQVCFVSSGYHKKELQLARMLELLAIENFGKMYQELVVA
jgi:hypothetical protein